MENSQYFPHITAGVKYHNEVASSEIIFQLEFQDNGDEEYKFATICDNVVYAKKSESGHLPGLYYLISWKGYPEKENTWEPISAI